MSPDQDLRLTCIELAQDFAEKERTIEGSVPMSRKDIVDHARRYYRFILGKDERVTSAQISPPHRVVARIRQGVYEQEYEED